MELNSEENIHKILVNFQNYFGENFKCLGKTIHLCNSYEPVIVSNKFVYEIILDMCNDLNVQKNVLEKLDYFSTNYPLEICYISKNFNKIMKQLKNDIIKTIINTQKQIRGIHIINFITETENQSLNIKLLSNWDNKGWNKNEIEHPGKYSSVDDDFYNPNYYYSTYIELLCNSIVGQKTIDEWDINGFIALLILYIDTEFKLFNEFKYEPYSEIVQYHKKIAESFNMMLSYKFNSVRESLNIWYTFLKKIEDFNKISDSIKFIDHKIQVVLFKQSDINYGFLEKYVTDYIIYFCDNFLKCYINKILKATTKQEWINIIESLLELDDIHLNKIHDILKTNHDVYINRVLFFYIDLNATDDIRFKVREFIEYKEIDGKKYYKMIKQFNKNKYIHSEKLIYNKDLTIEKKIINDKIIIINK